MLPQAVMAEVRPAQARFSGPGLVEGGGRSFG